jgi:hypothetical protein
VTPLIIAPLKPSSLTVRSSSMADAAGLATGTVAKPAKRFGWSCIASGSSSLTRCASGMAMACGKIRARKPYAK